MSLESVSKLSINDSLVLSALFDPESSLSSTSNRDISKECPSNNFICPSVEQCTLPEELDALKSLSVQDPSLGNIEDALSRLAQVCEQAPNNASVWCNRAQATRLYIERFDYVEHQGCQNDTLQSLLQNPVLAQRIFDDLDRAITLATPTKSATLSVSKSEKVYDFLSALQARVLAAAHAHRGYLLWQFSRAEFEIQDNEIPQPYAGLDRSSLEEIANREFTLSGSYGNEMAQKISVLTNPYAKLCGNIVKEVLKREMEEQNVEIC